MTPKPDGDSRLSWPKVLLAGLASVGVALYASGYFLLWSIRVAPETASPLTIPRYAYHYWHLPPVRQRIALSCLAGFLSVGIAAGAILAPRRRGLHGDARWATRREVEQAGLFAENGILLGKRGKRFVTLGGQQGVIVAAPPRSGKGVGVVIPNLLNWAGSVICLDIKQENWKLTAGYRARFGEVFLFNPFASDGRTARWNPLSYVSENPHLRIDDLQRIAAMLCVEVPGSDPFWVKSARSLFVGIALYLFERRDYERGQNAKGGAPIPEVPVTIGEILRQAMASDEEGFATHWKRIIQGWHDLGKPLSPQCVSLIMDVVDLAPQTASSVRKTFTSQLDLWMNPLLDMATSANDFDLRDLRRRKMSVYLGVSPRDFQQLQAVMNLFFQQAIGEQTVELPEYNAELKYQLLVLLDEFTAVGRIPILLTSIAFVPGYNVRTLMVIQTPAQLHEVYGAQGAKIMLKTLAARVVFAPNDIEDAKQISEELGYRTVRTKTHTVPSFFSGRNRSPSVNISEQRRALMLPQEVKEMGASRQIVFYENVRPIQCRKIRYYDDAAFTDRLLPPPQLEKNDLSGAVRARTDDHFGMWRAAGFGAGEGTLSGTPKTPQRGRKRAAVTADVQRDLLDEFDEDFLFERADITKRDSGEREFSMDFSDVDIPTGPHLTREELDQAARFFFADLAST